MMPPPAKSTGVMTDVDEGRLAIGSNARKVSVSGSGIFKLRSDTESLSKGLGAKQPAEPTAAREFLE